MYETFVSWRNGFFHFSYTKILKRFFFLLDPEFIHDQMLNVGQILGSCSLGRALTRVSFHYANPRLEQQVLGIKFANPIGLAAGFDKNAQITDILGEVGFGFAEVGSITGEPCTGNPKIRLWRLPKSLSLVVYYGLKNDGCVALAKRLTGKKFRLPVGFSVAKTNNSTTVDPEAGIADYAKAFEACRDLGSYLTVNISCPNAFGGEPFTDPAKLEKLLTRLDQIPTEKPIF
ncbi:MAG: quinone-dependent dihydroorotate dehydrogenase, partial [Alphaproteobacteria bacterium]|nr:quinone-dependent dihydroorotate dehydrogenase [Alphaproteobacteria bacterium]